MTQPNPEEGIHVVSPRLEKNAMDFALSYDAKTQITGGFMTLYANPGNPLHDILPSLSTFQEHCTHPLLLPALACSAWLELLSLQYRTVRQAARDNLERARRMEAYVRSTGNEKQAGNVEELDAEEMQARCFDIHQAILKHHSILSNALSYFVEDFGKILTTSLLTLQKAKPSRADDASEELEMFIQRLNAKIVCQLKQREQLKDRIDNHLQVLHTLMQQLDNRTNLQIAEETKRDSSATKSLALITAVFLPMTAISTMFSMGTFFAYDATRPTEIFVSPHFWIFWAVVGPMTVILVGSWFVWINRTDLMDSMDDARERRLKRRRDREKHRNEVLPQKEPSRG